MAEKIFKISKISNNLGIKSEFCQYAIVVSPLFQKISCTLLLLSHFISSEQLIPATTNRNYHMFFLPKIIEFDYGSIPIIEMLSVKE